MAHQNEFWNKFYETAWAKRSELMNEWIAAGETDPFALIQRMKRYEENHKLTFQGTNSTYVEIYNEAKPGEELLPTKRPKFKIMPLGENHVQASYYKDPVELMLDYIEGKKFDAIIELGSGYAQNILEMFYRGGPKNIPYYAGEFSESGTSLARALASLRPDLNFTAFHYDHKNPDFSAVKKTKRALVFTCHSIEQVTEISLDMFKGIASVADHVTCFHFEPFGFQLSFDNAAPGVVSIEQSKCFLENGWNLNLGPSLIEAHRQKMIDLKWIGKNIMGETLTNPTSLAVWESVV